MLRDVGAAIRWFYVVLICNLPRAPLSSDWSVQDDHDLEMKT